MVSKYHKIRYKSGRNNSINPFFLFTGCVLISYIFYKEIMASVNLPPQRGKIVVRGNGNSFYRAIALWSVL